MKNKLNKVVFENNLIPVILLILWAIFITKISEFVINGSMSYDMRFHLARIVGLAQSISNRDILPNINNIFSWGTGYASNMFYGNWQLYIPAFVFIVTQNSLFSFLVLAFTVILLESLSTYFFIGKIVKDNRKSFWLAIIIPCFFPLYSFGMTIIVGLVPILLYALYKVIYEDKINPLLLAITVSLLIQSHIISTLILAIISILFIMLNSDKIKTKHIVSFATSAGLGLLLSSGFIIQYIELIHSQEFYFSWKSRDFPIPADQMFILDKNFNSGFSPITNFFDLPLKLLAIYYALNFNKLKRISKTLLCITFIMYLAMTPLLPWQTVLKNTFLGIIQYTERLSFFSSILLLIVVGLENEIKVVRAMSTAIVIMYFFGFVKNEFNKPNKVITNFMDHNFKTMKQAYKNPLSTFVNPVGDEYYTVDINHVDVRDRKFADVSDEKNVVVNSVRYGYNKIELDYRVIDKNKKGSVVVPKIYYKGYVANYSGGAKGSQPMLQLAKKTARELKKDDKKKMPKATYKVLNNGKIYLTLEGAGKVLVVYKKTIAQKIGYTLETFSWIVVISGLMTTGSRGIYGKNTKLQRNY
ncbi:hypothetical protein ACVRZD_08445 [Streptococcus hongkongensis]